MPKPRRGRPRAEMSSLSSDRILDEALALLAEGGPAGLTMRALARRLGVDAMAFYHYFPDKDALLSAAAERTFAACRPRRSKTGDWRTRLRALARAYLRTVHPSRELLLFVTESGRASRPFDEHFFAATTCLALTPAQRRVCRDTFVDLLHGVALAGFREAPSRELELLFAGMEAIAARGTARHRTLVDTGIVEP